MRVLHFYRVYFPENETGIPRTIRSLVRAGSKLGIDATVLALGPQRGKTRTEMDGHTVWKAHRDGSVGSADFSASVFGLFSELARQTDVVHYHFPWPFMDLVHLVTRPRKPTVVTYHSDIVRQKRALWLYRPAMNAFLGRVDRIVATSPPYVESSEVLRRYRDKVAVVPLGLDEDHPRADAGIRDAWRQRFGERFFLFTGELRYYKGLDALLDAARRVSAPIVILGDGPLGPELKRKAAAERIDNVHFVGRLGDADKFALLDLCRAFIFPSNVRSEAFGLSLIEASMAGKPMVTCEIGTGTSFVNVAGLTGFVVPPDDPAALAGAMERLATDDGLVARMGAEARRRYERLFTAEAMGRGYLEVYRGLEGGRRS
jgi:rhamnosyl/mannosyltransferase